MNGRALKGWRGWPPIVPVCVLASAIALGAGAQEDAAPKPGAEKVKGRTAEFTVEVPSGWRYSSYDRAAEKLNADIVLHGLLGGEAMVATDHINFWWYEGDETLSSGIASLHRLQSRKELLITALHENLDSESLPAGISVQPQQIGKYVGLLGGGVVRGSHYIGALVMVEANVAYLATILGPKDEVQARWASFMGLLSSLNAPDLVPRKISEVFPNATEQPDGASDGG